METTYLEENDNNQTLKSYKECLAVIANKKDFTYEEIKQVADSLNAESKAYKEEVEKGTKNVSNEYLELLNWQSKFNEAAYALANENNAPEGEVSKYRNALMFTKGELRFLEPMMPMMTEMQAMMDEIEKEMNKNLWQRMNVKGKLIVTLFPLLIILVIVYLMFA